MSCDADQNFLYNVCDLSPCPDSHVCNRELAHTYSSTQLLSLWSCMKNSTLVEPSPSFSNCTERERISEDLCSCPFGYTGPTCEGTTSIIMLWHHQITEQILVLFLRALFAFVACDVGVFPEDCNGPDAFLQCLNNCTLANITKHPCCVCDLSHCESSQCW